MENVLEQLFSLSTIILCLMISVLVQVQKKLAEHLFPSLKASKAWNEIWLPLGPLGTGALIGFFLEQYPWPADFTSPWARVFFGVVCGLGSAHVYRIFKKFVFKKEEAPAEKIVENLFPPSDK